MAKEEKEKEKEKTPSLAVVPQDRRGGGRARGGGQGGAGGGGKAAQGGHCEGNEEARDLFSEGITSFPLRLD